MSNQDDGLESKRTSQCFAIFCAAESQPARGRVDDVKAPLEAATGREDKFKTKSTKTKKLLPGSISIDDRYKVMSWFSQQWDKLSRAFDDDGGGSSDGTVKDIEVVWGKER